MAVREAIRGVAPSDDDASEGLPDDSGTVRFHGSDRCATWRWGGRPRLACRQGVLAALAAALCLSLPQAAAAQWSMPDELPANRAVLELYTAQGCSACPPADAMMAELAMREDVIALSLHVDYWDYIGWSDTFGRAAHTQRQTRYARRHGASTIYTPQVVINGMEIIEGFRVSQVMQTLAAHVDRPAPVVIDLERREAGAEHLAAAAGDDNGVLSDEQPRAAADRLYVRVQVVDEPMSPLALTARAATRMPALMGTLEGDADAPPARLHLVRYKPTAEVEILAGENAGRHVQYFNVVTDWARIGTWDMQAPLELVVEIEGSEPAVVILQEAGQGAILAAARLR